MPTALVAEAGWNQVAADWRIFLDFGTVYAVRDSDGRVIATAATLPYGGQFAWISMVLVAGALSPAAGWRRGCCIAASPTSPPRASCRCSTRRRRGATVYAPLGFEDAGAISGSSAAARAARARCRRCLTAFASSRSMTRPGDDLTRYDATVFGADRSRVLARLRGRLPAADLVARAAGSRLRIPARPRRPHDDATGSAGRRGRRDRAGAARARPRAIDGPVYIDLADAKAPVRAWLDALGFAAQRPLTRMLLGRARELRRRGAHLRGGRAGARVNQLSTRRRSASAAPRVVHAFGPQPERPRGPDREFPRHLRAHARRRGPGGGQDHRRRQGRRAHGLHRDPHPAAPGNRSDGPAFHPENHETSGASRTESSPSTGTSSTSPGCNGSSAENRSRSYPAGMEGEMLKGHLDMIVLAALAPGPAHGYAVIEEIKRKERRARSTFAEGTIYPVLHRLEQGGLWPAAG